MKMSPRSFFEKRRASLAAMTKPQALLSGLSFFLRVKSLLPDIHWRARHAAARSRGVFLGKLVEVFRRTARRRHVARAWGRGVAGTRGWRASPRPGVLPAARDPRDLGRLRGGGVRGLARGRERRGRGRPRRAPLPRARARGGHGRGAGAGRARRGWGRRLAFSRRRADATRRGARGVRRCARGHRGEAVRKRASDENRVGIPG
jgi:hypothetical protein